MSTFRRLEFHVHDPDSVEAVTFEDFRAVMHDRRKFHSPSYRDKTERLVHYKPKLRKFFEGAAWKDTTSIMLHQTACSMGERIERYDTIGAHFSVLRSGNVIQHSDENRYVIHGHGGNQRCVGIEIDGLYSGLLDDPNTAPNEALLTTWNSPSTPHRDLPMDVTPHAMRTVRMLVRWICINVARHGGKISYLMSHRQSSSDRKNDPGQAIMMNVWQPLFLELGLSDGGAGWCFPDSNGGRPNPTVWTGVLGKDGKEIRY